ncbi:MAG TPA: AAA family ATPase [Actinomycetes bacterium]|nr:AAA family ATPase [Actinomycetes bacterium]
MTRYIVTGAPGCGKTSVLRELQALGYDVVDEAATDLITAAQAQGDTETVMRPEFLDTILREQISRQKRADTTSRGVLLHDRSPLCTLALAIYCGHTPSTAITNEVNRIVHEGTFEQEVFFVRPIGFVERTAVRRISYDDSLAFERIHEAVYRDHGYKLVDIEPADIADRAASIDAFIKAEHQPRGDATQRQRGGPASGSR